ncbi:hypothetical protein [Bradyrhizobium elkanii]|uniref:Uncharacterized protein n=1 Tax=Bradyrhizobium elkanii TaxID=29448 RepID=A0A8I1YDL7_BRAEL|nr:hypothetical protein [Bradyrhizobium elkanii]MBP1296639.1 hypothetical protein [Bradyrhizobium elkanii]
MSKGDVYRALRSPQVARSTGSNIAVITLNGEEDEFVVLQMAGAEADELARKLHEAGYGVTRR